MQENKRDGSTTMMPQIVLCLNTKFHSRHPSHHHPRHLSRSITYDLLHSKKFVEEIQSNTCSKCLPHGYYIVFRAPTVSKGSTSCYELGRLCDEDQVQRQTIHCVRHRTHNSRNFTYKENIATYWIRGPSKPPKQMKSQWSCIFHITMVGPLSSLHLCTRKIAANLMPGICIIFSPSDEIYKSNLWMTIVPRRNLCPSIHHCPRSSCHMVGLVI